MAEPFRDIRSNVGLTEKNLEAVLKTRGISDFLKYRDYVEYEEGKGIYIMSDWRKGIVLRIAPPAFLTSSTEEKVRNFLSTIEKDDTVVQFITYSSRNISTALKAYRDYHHCNVNVKNPSLLRRLVEQRVDSYQKWSRTSMLKGIDFRLREFHNLLVILFPDDTDDDYILRTFDEIKGSMADFHPENYARAELETILNEIFHPEKDDASWQSKGDELMEMNHSIVSGGVEVSTARERRGFEINNRMKAKVLTTKSFPKDINLFEYNSIFFDRIGTQLKVPIPGPFLLSLTIRYDNVEKAKKKIVKRLDHDMGELGKMRPRTLKANPDLKDRLRETEDIIRFVKQRGEMPLKAMWTLTLFEEDEKKLNETTATIINRFREKDWEIVEESSNNIALMSFLYSLPLQYSEGVEKLSSRFRLLFKANNASICPIIGDSSGGGNYHMLFVGRTGQLQRFDPYFSNTNYNIVKIGSSGSGKSYSEADFHLMSLAAGYRLRVIDAGDSYKGLCHLVGGQYITFEDDNHICLNFFTKINTVEENGVRKIHEDEFSTIVPIIGMMAGLRLRSTFTENESDVESDASRSFLAKIVERAIMTAFEREGFDAKLQDVRDALVEFNDIFKKEGAANETSLLTRVITSLYSYADPDGAFYSYFNGANNVDLQSDYVVLEIDALRNKGDMYQIVMMMISNQVAGEYYKPSNRGRQKMFEIDEAWMVFDNVIIVSFLEDLYRRIRKYNGIAGTIVQGLDDYYKNSKTIALYENANWKWFLEQENDSIEKALGTKRITLDAFEAKLMKSIRNRPPLFGESYIKSSKISLVARLKTDTQSHWTYTNSPHDTMVVEKVMKRHDFNGDQARSMLAMVADGTPEAEAVELVRAGKFKQEPDEIRIKKTALVVDAAIKTPSLIKFTAQPISSSVNGEVDKRAVYSAVENNHGVTSEEIFRFAPQIENFTQYEKVLIAKQLEKIATRSGRYAINISLDGLIGGEIVPDICAAVQANPSLKGRLVIDLPLSQTGVEHADIIRSAIEALHDCGALVSNVNMKGTSRFGDLLEYDFDYVKLDRSIVSELIQGNPIGEAFVLMVSHGVLRHGGKIVVTHIETEEEAAFIEKSTDIHLMQGYHIGMPEPLN
ncbi:TraC family protein [Thiomicrolovo sp. ZZH C-3]